MKNLFLLADFFLLIYYTWVDIFPFVLASALIVPRKIVKYLIISLQLAAIIALMQHLAVRIVFRCNNSELLWRSFATLSISEELTHTPEAYDENEVEF